MVLFQIRSNAKTFNPLVTSLLEILGCPNSCLIPPAIQQRLFLCKSPAAQSFYAKRIGITYAPSAISRLKTSGKMIVPSDRSDACNLGDIHAFVGAIAP
jgi:hypothetical protein